MIKSIDEELEEMFGFMVRAAEAEEFENKPLHKLAEEEKAGGGLQFRSKDLAEALAELTEIDRDFYAGTLEESWKGREMKKTTAVLLNSHDTIRWSIAHARTRGRQEGPQNIDVEIKQS